MPIKPTASPPARNPPATAAPTIVHRPHRLPSAIVFLPSVAPRGAEPPHRPSPTCAPPLSSISPSYVRHSVACRAASGRFVLVMECPTIGGNMTSIYTEIGGHEALTSVVDDFYGRVLADPQLAPFFAG